MTKQISKCDSYFSVSCVILAAVYSKAGNRGNMKQPGH